MLAGYAHVYLARIGDAVFVYGPPDHPLPDLSARAVDEVFTPSFAASLAGDRLDVLLGPSQHAFASAPSLPADPRVRQVTYDELASLEAECPHEEWHEGGFGHEASDDDRYYLVDGRAAGNLTPFDGTPADIGLVTHPSHRGQGLARAIGATMLIDALTWTDLVRYRALTTNAPSLAVAAALGFVPCGQNMAVRLQPA
jgi:GNAT superfamily N-acetyltransferase